MSDSVMLVQECEDLFKQDWKDVARVVQDPQGGVRIEALGTFPVIAALQEWCRDGILLMSEDPNTKELAWKRISPADPKFFEEAQKRLGYHNRFVPLSQAKTP
ncbi:MAG: hypothetical protein HYU64_13405 [Armatimonadetes bacterium]|nr:hypothetical protein [Armatimonadota bacterium]